MPYRPPGGYGPTAAKALANAKLGPRPQSRPGPKYRTIQEMSKGNTFGLQNPVRGAQRALETVGLSGAAHPIRRLQHPGGRMALPWFGGGAGRAVFSAVERKALVDSFGEDVVKRSEATHAAEQTARRAHPIRSAARAVGGKLWTEGEGAGGPIARLNLGENSARLFVGASAAAGVGTLGYEYLPKFGALARSSRPAPKPHPLPIRNLLVQQIRAAKMSAADRAESIAWATSSQRTVQELRDTEAYVAKRYGPKPAGGPVRPYHRPSAGYTHVRGYQRGKARP